MLKAKNKLTEDELNLLEELEESSEEQEEEDEEEDEEVDRGDVFDDEDDEDDESDDEDEDSGNDNDDDEDDEDDEGGDEEEDDEGDDEDDEEQERNRRVPRSRLNEVIKQREAERERSRWLEEQLETLIKSSKKDEQVAPPEPEFDFDSAEEQYVDLVLEGDKAAARQLRREIDAARAKEVEARFAALKEEAATSAKTMSESAIQEQKYQKVLESALVSHDFLNHESDSYNEKAVKMANKLMNSYIADGMPKGEALAEAVKDIVPLFGKPVDKKATDRTKQARKAAVDASKKQPKTADRKGTSKSRRDLETINIGKLSEKDFNSLTEREKKALRGD